MAMSGPKLTLDKHAVLSREQLEQLYAEVDRLSGEVVQLEMENVLLRSALGDGHLRIRVRLLRVAAVGIRTNGGAGQGDGGHPEDPGAETRKKLILKRQSAATKSTQPPLKRTRNAYEIIPRRASSWNFWMRQSRNGSSASGKTLAGNSFPSNLRATTCNEAEGLWFVFDTQHPVT
jgi:hypothetical protein